ncbi:hypothetical protein [Streptomyces cucumeris]|uniref:hypothetical protein n=1 Tax=Streptomyces cucumeris TaxID=2962890 RepID=UPI0020C88A18|nr:hypothetical protein [Streptomyces sp. NEAU-Y11]MCP9209555.1 hypothetical protein [Streptomyces sp. NEAU-Y11]
MIVTTRKLDATDTTSDRIRVVAEDGATATYPYPYKEGLHGRDAHAWAVRRLFPGPEFDAPVWMEETSRGEKFIVTDGEKLRQMDKETMKDSRVSLEERQAAFQRHNRRTAGDEISRGNA